MKQTAESDETCAMPRWDIINSARNSTEMRRYSGPIAYIIADCFSSTIASTSKPMSINSYHSLRRLHQRTGKTARPLRLLFLSLDALVGRATVRRIEYQSLIQWDNRLFPPLFLLRSIETKKLSNTWCYERERDKSVGYL